MQLVEVYITQKGRDCHKDVEDPRDCFLLFKKLVNTSDQREITLIVNQSQLFIKKKNKKNNHDLKKIFVQQNNKANYKINYEISKGIPIL